MRNDVSVRGPLPYPHVSPGITEVRPQVARPAEAFRAAGRPCAIVGEPLPPGAPPLKADLLLSGEPQTLGEREVERFKPRWGGFYRTRFDELLRG